MGKKHLNKTILSLIALFTLIHFTSFHRSVIAESINYFNTKSDKKQTQSKNKQESGSDRGRPTQREGVATRNDCPARDIPLTALIPENKVSKVIEPNPKFWLFIPYKPNKIPTGEFILQDEAHNDVYRTNLSIKQGEGIVSINLPSEVFLEENQVYQWYFKLFCNDPESSTPIYVRGWVQRVALQANQQNQLNAVKLPRHYLDFYNKNDIWYSALTKLAELRQANPDSEVLAKYWSEILNDIGLQQLSNKPIVGNLM